MTRDDDPGWLPAFRPWWHFFLPLLPLWLVRRPLDLVGLRHLFVHTGIALIEVTLAVSLSFDAEPGTSPPIMWLIAVGIVGYEGVALIWVARRPLPAGSGKELADSFRARSLIQLGLAAAPGLYGIAASYLFNRPELPWLGTVFSLVLLAWVAPTRSRLDRIDEEVRASGSSLTIRSALRETT